MRTLDLFAGAGGGLYGGAILGWSSACAVEIDPYCRKVLRAKFPEVEIHDDVRTFDGRPWRGRVDVITGGFPCQDVSLAGRGGGLDGARSGLWREFARIIGEAEPAFALIENSPALRGRGLDRVLRDLAALGFDAEWTCLSASAVGAPHRRNRIWILAAHPDRLDVRHAQQRQEGRRLDVSHGGRSVALDHGEAGHVAHPDGQGELQPSGPHGAERQRPRDGGMDPDWDPWAAEPDLDRVAHGMAHGGDRLRALGNGQVPLVAATAACGLAARFGLDWRPVYASLPRL